MATPPPCFHPHHTMMKIVFLQKVLPFAATKKESSAIFKSVSSSWEETILNYSGAVLCLKAYVGSEQEKRQLQPANNDVVKNNNSSSTKKEIVGLQLLLNATHIALHSPCPIWIIEALFDVCDLLKLRFADDVNYFAAGRDCKGPFLTLVLLEDVTHEALIYFFNRMLKLFGDHDGNTFANEEKGTEKQQKVNTLIREVLTLRSPTLVVASSRKSVEFLQFLVKTFERLGGTAFLSIQLERSHHHPSIFDVALSWGRLDKLTFFCDTILGIEEKQRGEGKALFLKICRKINSNHRSLLAAACRYQLPKQPELSRQIFVSIKYLMDKIRSVWGDEEVKKQLELFRQMPLKEFDKDIYKTLMNQHAGSSSSSSRAAPVGMCSIHFACQFGSLEMLQYVLDLAGGFGEAYLKRFLSLRCWCSSPDIWPDQAIVDTQVFPPLNYVLQQRRQANQKAKIDLLVDHLLIFGKDSLEQQWKQIEWKIKRELSRDNKIWCEQRLWTTWLHQAEVENVNHFIHIVKERGCCFGDRLKIKDGIASFSVSHHNESTNRSGSGFKRRNQYSSSLKDQEEIRSDDLVWRSTARSSNITHY